MITTARKTETVAWQGRNLLRLALKTLSAIINSLSFADIHAIEKRKLAELHEAGLDRW